MFCFCCFVTNLFIYFARLLRFISNSECKSEKNICICSESQLSMWACATKIKKFFFFFKFHKKKIAKKVKIKKIQIIQIKIGTNHPALVSVCVRVCVNSWRNFAIQLRVFYAFLNCTFLKPNCNKTKNKKPKNAE